MTKTDLRGKCKLCGRRTRHQIKGEWFCKICEMGLEKTLTNDENKILEEIKKSRLSPEEIRVLLKHGGEKEEENKKPQPYQVKGSKLRFGVISDTHIGSKFYDPRVMKQAAKIFNQKDVNFVVHVGDITEGHYENKRQGSVFELTEIGGDAQVARAVKELSQIKKPIYGITGNHEHNTFYKLAGFDIGKQLAEKMPNFNYLGNMHGTIKLPYGKTLELLHPGGGSSYALSYKPQKIVESLEGGTKPDVLLIGHFHKALYMYYRNVHAFMTGTLQSQTSFMRENGLSAHKGFYLIDLEVGKNGVNKITPSFFPAY